MNAFVTGATGLIGYHLVRQLVDAGVKVKALVRSSTDTRRLGIPGVELCYGDILSIKSLKCANKCDIIFHAAGAFSYWGYERTKFIEEARQGMENVILTAQKCAIPKVIFTSSSVTAGCSDEPRILNENEFGNFDDAPTYVLAKVEQEKTAFKLARKTGVSVVAICPTLTVGGPDMHLTESNRIIINYIRDPFKSSWIGGCNIVSVHDVAKAMILLAEKGINGEKYIAGSSNLSWKQLHTKISTLCGLPGPYFEAYRTSSYLLSAIQELLYPLTKQRPASTREQAKMVGKYYWYSSEKLSRLGYDPISADDALIDAISWLVTSDHIPASVRAEINLSEDVYTFRKQKLS